MQLKIRRSQKTSGMLSKSITFAVDAVASLDASEASAVDKYKLGGQIIYSSEVAKRHAATAASAAAGRSGIVGGLAAAAMSRMSLSITVDSLRRGQHIEAKDLDEVLGAEEALKEACQSLKAYLEIAQTFDGSEQVLEF